MPPKTIYVLPDGTVFPSNAITLFSGNVVRWKPRPDLGYEVRIRFVKRVPFRDWGHSKERSGPFVSGTVKIHVGRVSYEYKASWVTQSLRVNPKLIVEGGGGLGRKPKARKRARATKKARAAKK